MILIFESNEIIVFEGKKILDKPKKKFKKGIIVMVLSYFAKKCG